MFSLWTTAWSTWELPISQISTVKKSSKKNIAQVFKEEIVNYLSTFRIRSFRQHLEIYLCSFTGMDIIGTVFTFFCIYCLKLSATNTANLMAVSIVGIGVTLVGGYLITKISPKSLYFVAYTLTLSMLIAYLVMTKFHASDYLPILFVIAVVYQIGTSLLGFVPWQVYPFIPDIDEIVTGKNRAGTLASVMNLLRNVISSLATVFVGIFLDFSGFTKGVTQQSVNGRNAITELMIIGGVLVVIAWIIASKFNLNKHSHKIIVNEIDRLKHGGSKKDASEETKKVVKDLTGYEYEQVWNVNRIHKK